MERSRGEKLDETNLQTVGNWRKIINCDKIYIKAKNDAKKNFKHCQFSANNFGINGFLVGNKKKSK